MHRTAVNHAWLPFVAVSFAACVEPEPAVGIEDQELSSTSFLLEVAGITPVQKTIIGGFKSMSGADSETGVIEFRSGTVATTELLRWDAAGDARDGIITVFDERAGTVTGGYRFFGARPIEILASWPKIEKLELATEKIERVVR